MGTPTRFPNGVTTARVNDDLGSLVILDPTKTHVDWEDFNVYTAADWIVTAVGTSPVAGADVDGGAITVTTGGTENNGDWLQRNNEGFLLETGKKSWLKARVMFDVVDEMDFVFGLHSTSTTPQAATMRHLFESVDGSAALYFNNDDNTTDTDSGTLHTLVAATWVEMAAHWDGKGNIKLYIDGALKEKMTGITVPGAEMALGFGCITGATAVVVMTVDYVLAVKER